MWFELNIVNVKYGIIGWFDFLYVWEKKKNVEWEVVVVNELVKIVVKIKGFEVE